MAISTVNTKLMYCATESGTYKELLPITSYPDMGGTPSKLDTTDLSAIKYKTGILGLQEIPDLVFEANYDEDLYGTISALTTTQWFKLYFGTDGEDGIFKWSGNVSIFVMGGGVDEVRKMQVTLSAETEIVAM